MLDVERLTRSQGSVRVCYEACDVFGFVGERETWELVLRFTRSVKGTNIFRAAGQTCRVGQTFRSPQPRCLVPLSMQHLFLKQLLPSEWPCNNCVSTI